MHARLTSEKEASHGTVRIALDLPPQANHRVIDGARTDGSVVPPYLPQ